MPRRSGDAGPVKRQWQLSTVSTAQPCPDIRANAGPVKTRWSFMPGNARLLIGHGRAKNDFFIMRLAMPIIWAWLGIIKNWPLTTNDFTLQLLIGRCVEWYFFASLWLILRCVGLDTHWILTLYKLSILNQIINYQFYYSKLRNSQTLCQLTTFNFAETASQCFRAVSGTFPAFWQIPFTHCSGLPFKTNILPSFAEQRKYIDSNLRHC